MLGFVFFFKSKKSIKQEAGTYWNSNPHVQRSIIAGKFDGMAGTFLLFVGFIYQALGYLGLSNQLVVSVSYGFLIVFVFGYVLYFRNYIVNSWCDALDREVENENGK